MLFCMISSISNLSSLQSNEVVPQAPPNGLLLKYFLARFTAVGNLCFLFSFEQNRQHSNFFTFFSNHDTMNTIRKVFLVAGKRTPFGKFGESLKDITPNDLCVHSAKALLKDTNMSNKLDKIGN